MYITRIYSDEEGESHFEDTNIQLYKSGEIGHLSDRFPASNIIFRENDGDYNYDWHTAPSKQYIILLDGEIELQVSDGEKRIFKGGDVLLVEDTSGKGHKTKSINDLPRRSIFVTIE